MIEEIFDNSTMGIVIVDAECTVVWLNKTFEMFFGLPRAALMGQDYRRVVRDRLSPVLANSQVFTEKILSAYRDNSHAEQFECQILEHGERRERWLEHRSHPIGDGNYSGGRIEHYTDITDRKRSEHNHQKLTEQVQHAQKMESIGILAGGIAHDFNNILQAISGYTQLLMMEKQFNDPDFDMLNEIETAARKACILTQQLLAFSRRVESTMNPTDLNDTVTDVKNILARTIPKMIRIELYLSDHLKPVRADAGQIEQALMNLGVNAQQAMPDGGTLIFKTENVTLDQTVCESACDLNPGEYVRISVTDNGCGMDPETVAHVFDPFFTTRVVGQGSGLGLSMTYGIVKNHGGRIECASSPGEGTTFSIYLPAAPASAIELQRKNEQVSRATGNGETVLIVDDDEALLHLGKNILERFGYRTMAAPTGESALEIYKTNGDRIDLVLLDLNMPGMGGQKCLTELIRCAPGLKVIVASGYPPVGEIQELLQSVNGQFIGKPYQLNDMIQKVSDVLHSR